VTEQRVLVVDDDPGLRDQVLAALRQHGYPAVSLSAAEAVQSLGRGEALAVVTALASLEALVAVQAEVPVIALVGSLADAVDPLGQGAADSVVTAPLRPGDLALALRKADQRGRWVRERRRAPARPGVGPRATGLVGDSPALRRLHDTLRRVADHKATVLITGESGTGKELVARALHQLSPRAGAPFVAVNCGAIPEHLLESELFGHRRGAFTDATRDKTGLFEAANQGTLFLDEIGELPLGLQVKLLRALQEGKVRRLGDLVDVDVDVRVVAATVRDLAAMTRQGAFREDLYYRLNVIQVALPPLREHLEDVPLLVEHFLARARARLDRPRLGLAPGALALLLAHDWPGNVRELENCIEHATVLGERDEITEADLPARVREAPRSAPVLAEDEVDLSIKHAAHRTERELIRRALIKTGGNRTAAARLLEISHRALLYKLKDYAIDDL
jgi:two-component system response regulator AtoC